jgi:hypothetical protein
MSMVSPQLRKSAADSRDRGGAPEGGKVLVDADERDRVLQAGAAAQAGGDALRRDAAAGEVARERPHLQSHQAPTGRR